MPFVDAESVDLKQRAIISVEGLRGTGKTEFGLWGRAPVAYHRFDMASEGSLRKMRDLRPGAIKVSTYDFERPKTEKTDKNKVLEFSKVVVDLASETLNSFISDYRYALANGFNTIVVDDGGTLWEILRIARFGKVEQVPQNQYGIVNWEFKRLLKETLEHDATLVILHPLKEEWMDYDDGNGRKKSTKTGRYEPMGFSKMDVVAHAILRTYRAGDPTDPDKTAATSPTYGQFCAQFTKCNENGLLVGRTVNFAEYAEVGMPNTFGVAMSLIYEGTAPEQWL